MSFAEFGESKGRAAVSKDIPDDLLPALDFVKKVNSRNTELGRLQLLLGTMDDTPAVRKRIDKIIIDQNEALKKKKDVFRINRNSFNDATAFQRERLSESLEKHVNSYKSLSQQVKKSIRPRTIIPLNQSGERLEREEISDDARQLLQLEQDVDYNESLIGERENDIHRIHQVVIMNWTNNQASMVQDQGRQIETIDDNISTAVRTVDKGLGSLNTASRRQKSLFGWWKKNP